MDVRGARPRGACCTRRRVRQALVASLAGALALGACTAGGSESPPRPVGTASPSGSPVRVAAPDDCAVNAYCAIGLADVYGVDVSQSLVPSARLADSVAQLEGGQVDVAVVFSPSPYVDDPDLVVLEDDRQMIAADNVVPVYRRSVDQLFDGRLRQDLDDLAALITDDALSEIDRMLAEGEEPARAAAKWLREVAPAPGSATRSGPRLRVGTAGFLESRALGDVIAHYLHQRGYRVTVVERTTTRAQLVDALANGDVDIVPEYTAALLEYLNGDAGEAGADGLANYRRLRDYVDLIGARLADMAPAVSSNVFVTTVARSDELGLERLSDLHDLGLPAVDTHPPAGIADTPAELGVLVRAVGHQLAAGSRGPEVRDLQQRLVELGYDVSVNGRYDGDTIAAVRDFQGQQGLAPTGVVRRSTEKALARPQAAADPNPVTPGDDGATDAPGDAAGKVIYLTFDDGPTPPYTTQILALLRKHNAKATFFELGQNATTYPELTKAVLTDGHAVASHTWDHAEMTKLSPTALTTEIEHTSRALGQLVGRPITCLRPPYGAVDDSVEAAIADHDLAMWLWDIDPQDWNRPGVDSIVSNVLANAHPGAVNLMHDGGGDRSQTVAALEQILPRLADQGYRFEALPGC